MSFVSVLFALVLSSCIQPYPQYGGHQGGHGGQGYGRHGGYPHGGHGYRPMPARRPPMLPMQQPCFSQQGGHGGYYPPQNGGGYNNYPSSYRGGGHPQQGYRGPQPNHTPWRGYAPGGQLNMWPGGGGFSY